MSRAISACLLSLGLQLCPLIAGVAAAQAKPSPATTTRPAPAATTARPVVTGPQAELSADYVIGPEDVVGVIFWREAEMTADVTVRPDGMISLPLLGDIKVAGLRPEALAVKLQEAAGKFLTEPNATVVVRQVNSRKVFITGEVRTPGAIQLSGPRTVMQAIALAGGLTEYADSDKITIMRGAKVLKFNYKEVSKGKHPEQNIQLQPMDTITVP